MAETRKTGAEIIAFVTGQDFADMKENRYQSTRTSIPVYTIGSSYYCCPTLNEKQLPKDFDWVYLTSAYGRSVYVMHTPTIGDKKW